MIIQPAVSCGSTLDAHVELINLATGGSLGKSLGEACNAVVRQLYQHPETLQSATCTWAAGVDGEIVGQVGAVSYSEYSMRRYNSARLIRQASRVAGMRGYADDLCRWLSGTPLGPWADGQLYIQSLAVMPLAQRQGVGARLLRQVEAVCKELSCNALSLNVLASNKAALSLYEASGFSVVAQRGQRIKLLKVVG